MDVGLDVGECGGCVFYSGELDGLCKIVELCIVCYLFDEIFVLGSWVCEVIGWLEL